MSYGQRASCASLSMRQAAQALEHDKTIRLIDVRTILEYRSGHLPNSIHLPLDRIDQITERIPDRDERIFVYCHSGARSQAACQRLAALGYTDVTNIGGIIQWPGKIEF